jgi:hypothetical protein
MVRYINHEVLRKSMKCSPKSLKCSDNFKHSELMYMSAYRFTSVRWGERTATPQ